MGTPFPVVILTLVFGAFAIIVVYTVVLFLHGLLNTFGIGLVALLNDISVWWHLVGVAVIFLVLFFFPAHHQSAGFIFTKFVNNTGFGSGIYVFLRRSRVETEPANDPAAVARPATTTAAPEPA